MDFSTLSADAVPLWLLVLFAGLVVGLVLGTFFRKVRKKQSLPQSSIPEAPVDLTPGEKPVESTSSGTPVSIKADALERTRAQFSKLFGGWKSRRSDQVSESEWETLEEALLEADVGIRTARRLLDATRSESSGSQESLVEILRRQAGEVFKKLAHGPVVVPSDIQPWVISIVGVNGVGKTTTVGKLSHLFSQQGKSVLIGAGDSFRAAAIEQLQVWANRTRSDFVRGRENADPAAVAFDALTAAKARGADVVLFDTAGRLHTKVNLMAELARIHQVMKKVIPEAPHETWLVVDGTLGQNSVRQASEFHQALELTGVIVTKLDGTAKGGALLAIADELGLPIRYIGLGEQAENLRAFSPDTFLDSVFNI